MRFLNLILLNVTLFGNPLRTLLLQHDLYGLQDELYVEEEGHVGDVHQVHLELVVGRGVVFAVDLGITGETGLDAQAHGKFGEFADVLFGEFRALGARADDGHFTFQDIDQLGQLVQARGADEMADLGDAVIALGCKAGNTILFSICTHGTEFYDFKGFSVLRQALLAVKDGAAIIQFDGDGDAKHEGAGANQQKGGKNDVHRTLDDGVERRGKVVIVYQGGQVEYMHAPCGADQHVTDAGTYVGGDLMICAELDQFVAQADFHAAEKGGFNIAEPVG